MRPLTYGIASGLLVALVLTACAGTGGRASGGDAHVDGDWELVEGVVDGRPIEIVDGHRITLSVDGEEIGGVAACNRYFGRWRSDDGRLRIDEIGATEMACLPAVMEAEAAFLDALARVDRLQADGDRLTLTGDGVRLLFRRLLPPPMASLVGTRWMLGSLVRGETVSSVRGDPELVLSEDGSLSAWTGCRRLVGTWVESGDAIDVPELRAEGACPPDLADQDRHVVAVIEGGFRFTIEGDRLTLSDAGGRGLVFRAAQEG